MKGFTFFRNYYEAINDPENELTEEEQGKLYNAIFAYMFDGKEPELKGACRMAFNLIRVSLDLSKVRSENGRRGGEANDKQTESKTEANGSKVEANDKQTESEEDFACDLPLLEEEKEISTRKKVSNRQTTTARARARDGDGFGKGYASHADIMDRFGVEGRYREIVEEYLRTCYLNGHIVPNNALEDILSRLNRHYGADEEAKILSIRKAINGGYYDIAELRDAPELWR